MRRHRRRLGVAVAGMAVAGMVVATYPAVATGTDPDSSPSPVLKGLSAAATDNLIQAVAGGQQTLSLTLVTGDKVQVGITEDRQPVVGEIEPAPRPGNESVMFHTVTKDGQTYVVPDDALPLLRADTLDWELFNIGKLAAWVEEGTTGEVPAVAEYTSEAVARNASAAPGTTAEPVLASIDARPIAIEDNGRWWRAVQRTSDGTSAAAQTTGPLAGVDKVWLDELATLELEQSTAHIGAPAAWTRGFDGTGVKVAVLDSGIDATHPDLKDQILEQVDFTDSATGTVDQHGHGTHVASTIAGTGAAADGRERGVAPGAKLVIGRVCGSDGTCAGTDVIAGMEWAAQSGVDVVNMSLGGQATNGTDPLSASVNSLSRRYGTLFVISAGNNGPGSETVGSPGVADEALTVAAADLNDKIASFSSRGPRLGDGAAKPDITAPGVAVIAARASGTAMGTPVDDYYTTASGTSMASPHVAGAAAIVAQQHPDFTGRQIKAFLMGTSKDLGLDIYAQGAGRVDLDRATDPKIVATGNLNFGRAPYPHSPTSKTITYTNWTDEPITLTLDASASSAGKPAPAGLFTLSANQVTVPARGSADVSVTMDGTAVDASGQYGAYAGLLTAKDGAGTFMASSRLSVFVEPKREDLTIKVIPPTGATDISYGDLLVVPVDGDDLNLYEEPLTAPGGETINARVFAGTVTGAFGITWRDASGELQKAAPMLPELKITGPTTAEIDLRKIKPVMAITPERTETYEANFSLQRTAVDGDWGITARLNTTYGPGEPGWWVLPTGGVSLGTLKYHSQQVLVPPSVTMRVTGNGVSFDLEARYATPDTTINGGTQNWREDGRNKIRLVRSTIPRLPTNGQKPVVYAGTGTDGELAKVDAKGALLLLKPSDICTATCNFTALRQRVAAAAAAGAVGVLVTGETERVGLLKYDYRNYTCPTSDPDSCPPVLPYAELPIVTVPPAQAATLIQRIGGAGPVVQIELGGSGEVSKAYALDFDSPDRVPSNLPYQVLPGDLAQVTHRFHADRPGAIPHFSWNRFTESGLVTAEIMLPKPDSQREFTALVGPRNSNAVDRFEMSVRDWVRPETVLSSGPALAKDLVLGAKNTIDWNAGPSLPGAVPAARTKSGFAATTGLPCAGCREGDRFWPTLYLTDSGGSRRAMMGMLNDDNVANLIYGIDRCEPPACTVSLFDDAGQELQQVLHPVEYIFQLSEPGNEPDLASRSGE